MSLRKAKKPLSERMMKWRAERPDEWVMDEFIRAIKALEESNAEMLKYYIKLYKWCKTTELDISLGMMFDIGKIIEKNTGKKINVDKAESCDSMTVKS
ncbi:MAG: hypothetical protein GY853_00525 [PVC group bacterium]|nr:hypothetical protein [PVC group bacterium]